MQAFFEELQHATKPRLQRDLPRPGGPGGVLAGSLQPLLGNARMKIRAVSALLALHAWVVHILGGAVQVQLSQSLRMYIAEIEEKSNGYVQGHD